MLKYLRMANFLNAHPIPAYIHPFFLKSSKLLLLLAQTLIGFEKCERFTQEDQRYEWKRQKHDVQNV